MPSPGALRRAERLNKALKRLERLLEKSLDEMLENEEEPILEREVEVAIQSLWDLGTQR